MPFNQPHTFNPPTTPFSIHTTLTPSFIVSFKLYLQNFIIGFSYIGCKSNYLLLPTPTFLCDFTTPNYYYIFFLSQLPSYGHYIFLISPFISHQISSLLSLYIVHKYILTKKNLNNQNFVLLFLFTLMGYLSCNAESAIATCDPYYTKSTKTQFELRQFSSSDLYTATNHFSENNLLGKGSHGYVYKAHLDNGKLLAAVKKPNQTKPYSTLKFNTQISINTPAENEIEVLSRVRHARLVNLLGYATDHKTKAKLTVVELMPNGSLYDWLHGSDKPPGWVRRIRFALQVSKAVQYLHSSNPPIIHRDIKSSNVLIDGDCKARLGDFGLALRGHVEDVRVMCTPPAGTLGYLDPGYLSPGDLSSKSDVFSFGILLLEIISGRNAIDLNFSPSSVVDWAVPLIKSGDFAGICDGRIGVMEDEAAVRELGGLAAKCVRESVVKRPGMAEVVEVLKRVYKRVNSKIWNRIGRRVGECARGGEFEMVESSGEILKHCGSNRRNRKVASVSSVQIEVGHKGGRALKYENNELVVRSRSISSIREVIYGQLDESNCDSRNGGLGVKMHTTSTVRLSKSKSMGMLQGTRLMRNLDSELEESKLLVDLGNETLEKD